MPGGDRTGPLGMGPMTGRAMGYCAGYGMPGYMNPGFGRGFGYFGAGRGGIPWGGGRGRVFGAGRGFWWRTGAYAYPPFAAYSPRWNAAYEPEQEKEMLKEELGLLEEEMSSLRKRLDDLEKRPEEEK